MQLKTLLLVFKQCLAMLGCRCHANARPEPGPHLWHLMLASATDRVRGHRGTTRTGLWLQADFNRNIRFKRRSKTFKIKISFWRLKVKLQTCPKLTQVAIFYMAAIKTCRYSKGTRWSGSAVRWGSAEGPLWSSYHQRADLWAGEVGGHLLPSPRGQKVGGGGCGAPRAGPARFWGGSVLLSARMVSTSCGHLNFKRAPAVSAFPSSFCGVKFP